MVKIKPEIRKITSDKDRDIIGNSLNDYNKYHIKDTLVKNWEKIELVAKNEEGEVIGGLLAGLGYFKGLEIQILWVKEKYRKNNIGTQLLLEAEKIGKEKGATKSILDTYEFQAKDFYLKNNYHLFGELKDYPIGFSKYYFYKDL